jgi:hypothetical protein
MFNIPGHKGNANPNHFTSVRMATIKITNNNKCLQDHGGKEHSYTADGNVN